MLFASNKISEIKRDFQRRLLKLYDESEVDAIQRILFSKLLEDSDTGLLNKEFYLNQSELIWLNEVLEKLLQGIPLQYVLKEAWFLDQSFYVDNRVLIPRPETEELVALIQSEISNPKSIIDIGTGSGCIALTLKKHFPYAIVSGIDISERALEVAKLNAERTKSKVHFLHADILQKESLNSFAKFDLIVSNPPYITKAEESEMENNVLNYEPHLALFVPTNDPLLFYRRIAEEAKNSLTKNGKIYFEVNPIYAEEIKKLLIEEGYANVVLSKDITGKTRFCKAELI